MQLVKAYKDFITQEEKNVLNQWTLSNFKHNYFIDPKMDSNHLEKTKLTTRFANPLVNYGNPPLNSSSHDHINFIVYSNPNFTYPKVAYDIQKRIALTFEFEDFGLSPVGKDGIISEISFEGGTVHPHIDPIWFEGTQTVHFNIISQKPISGGITHIENDPWEVEETDLLSYIVSKAEHKVDEIVGKKERILWVFSFMLSESDVRRIFND